MTDFKKYKPEDFLTNKSFENYLLQNNKSDILFWQKWIKENPECKKTADEASLLYFLIRDQKEGLQNSDSIEKEYAQLQFLIKNSSPEKGATVIPFIKEKTGKSKNYSLKFVWKAAAVAAIFLTAISFWMYKDSSNNSPVQQEFVAFAKTEKQAENITLPDGSEVVLNNNSSLDISKEFNKAKREVNLTGSAFFKVHKDHSKPFIVTSGNLRTTAVGTSFYIYNLHAQSPSVSLLEGKVRIEGNKNSIYLLPGEKALLDNNDMVLKSSFNKEQLQNFTNGRITFEHADIKEIKDVFEEYFNMDVDLNGNVPLLNFTGNFDSKNIQLILESLQFTYNLKYKITGQKLILSFN